MTRHIVSALVVLFVTAIAVFSRSPLAYMTEPSLSPDRKEIAFVSGGDIWTVPAEGGIAQLLISHPANESRPLFSPDGRHLAFVSNRTGNGDIYIMDLATGSVRRLTFDDAAENLDAWSRDGAWIYFSSTARDIAGMNDIYRVPASGGTPMQVSSDRYTTEFSASPLTDGSFVFAARGIGAGQWWRRGRSHIDESEIWIKTGDRYDQLTQRGAKQLWPMATADGSRVYFVSDRNGEQNIWVWQRGGQQRQLTNFTDGRVLWASMSYDSREIVFERDFGIWKMDTNSGRAAAVPIRLRGASVTPITERVNASSQIRQFALSPDGKKVAMIARGEVFAGSSKEPGDAVRITTTAAPESYVSWSSDSRKVIYTSERSGTMTLHEYDLGAETETQLTGGEGNDFGALYSPDGKWIAFVRDARKLMVMDVASKQLRELARLYTDSPPLFGQGSIAWSPDSRWIAFLTLQPETRSYTNVAVVSVEGGPARTITFLANSNSNRISWAPDGSFIVFDTNQRTEDTFIARVDLQLRTPRFREDQFRDLFKQENPRDRQPPAPAASPAPSPAATPKADETKDDKKTEIVFDDIRRRLSLLNTGVNGGNPVISPDGKTLAILASAIGQFNIFTRTLDELATDTSSRQITTSSGFKSQAQFTPDSKEIYYLENGRINIAVIERRESRPLNLNIEIPVSFAEDKMETFNQGWRYLRDNFYDDKFHGVDWNAVRTRYEPLIAASRTPEEVRRLMSLMVGELNASHLGVSGGTTQPQATAVGKLGLRFDRGEYEMNGRVKITEVIALGPAAVVKGVNVGDFLLSVDGTSIAKGVNLDELLEGKVNRRVVLRVSSSPDGSNSREAVVRPVSTGAEKNLLYRQWVDDNRAYVARISGGKLGYVHLPDMGQGTLNQLYIDLDAENQSKDGVVVDIRNNNGGFINVYVIDILARRGYLTMRERGLWNVPARSALGQRALEKPTVLVTNQHSLSDAEDMTEGYRTLKLGKVVGEPTSGWIIYTWNAQLFDGTTVRLPRQLILGADGKNMEMNPRQVDVPVTRPIGETKTGRDSQLDRAVRELLGN
ncbi:MAG TPA: S41 family peptidase [Pyrinomonadaceae bacterium]|nr:S41 family peptidase [Pyrinomonadaceae bacterium]HMP64226.1 S41 family peptidase [Pyrinomonadaceae bacterium]